MQTPLGTPKKDFCHTYQGVCVNMLKRKTCVRKHQQKTFVTLSFGDRGCRVNLLKNEDLR